MTLKSSIRSNKLDKNLQVSLLPDDEVWCVRDNYGEACVMQAAIHCIRSYTKEAGIHIKDHDSLFSRNQVVEEAVQALIRSSIATKNVLSIGYGKVIIVMMLTVGLRMAARVKEMNVDRISTASTYHPNNLLATKSIRHKGIIYKSINEKSSLQSLLSRQMHVRLCCP